MLELGMALAFVISLMAGREALKKPTVIVMDGDKIVSEVKVSSPILVIRNGDQIEVRQIKRKALKKARAAREKELESK